MAGRVAKLVREGRIVIVAGVEVGKLGHDDLIAARLVIGLRSMVPNGYGNAGKEGVQLGVALVGIGSGADRRGGRILGFYTVALLGIEAGFTLEDSHLHLAIPP